MKYEETMRTMMDNCMRFFAYVWSNLGHCPRCMARSFQALAVLVAVTVPVHLATDIHLLRAALFVATVASAVLWLAHLTAFGIKTAQADRRRTTGQPEASRRRSLATIARAALFGFAATAWPFRIAMGASCSCPSRTPKCCWNFDAKIYVCAPSDAVCCAHASNPWHCGRDQNCYGERQCR